MLTVNHYATIRQLHRDGWTIRQIAEHLHHSPKTILKALRHPEPVRQPQPEGQHSRLNRHPCLHRDGSSGEIAGK